MNKITFPLRAGAQSPAVADLQEGLLLLLARDAIPGLTPLDRAKALDRLRRDRTEGSFAEGTASLLRQFQQRHGLPATGIVDEKTAAVLNRRLAELGVFAAEPAVETRVVTGQIRRTDRTPAAGLSVQAVHVDANGVHSLATEKTNADGRYAMKYRVPPAFNAINLRIIALDARGERLAESEVKAGAGASEVIDLAVPDHEAVTYTVSGHVVAAAGMPVSGVNVVIVDRGIADDARGIKEITELAATTTDRNGAYKVSFDDREVKRRGKSQPDVQARVFAAGTLAGESEIRYDASTSETLDVILSAAAKVPSEYDTLLASIRGHYTGDVSELKESEERSEITYLANKAGWDARAVAMASLAGQFSKRSGDGAAAIPPPFFYALFRAGVPANESAVYRADVQSVKAIWKQAIDERVIDGALSEKAAAAESRFKAVAATRALESPPTVGPSSLKNLIAVSLGDDDVRQKDLAEIVATHGGDSAAFWTAVRAKLGEPAEKRLRVDAQLALLTFNNAPLMAKVHTAAGGTGVQDVRKLVDLGYYDAKKWEATIGNDAVPKEISGTDVERKKKYAEVLAAQVRLSFPTAVVADMVKQKRTVLSKESARDQVHAFLSAREAEFHIGAQPVEQFAKQKKLTVDKGVLKEIERLQRVYQITPSSDAMNSLLAKGLDSSHAIVRMGEKKFVAAFAKDLGSAESAQLTYKRAEQVHASVLSIVISYLTAGTAAPIGVHSPPQIISPASTGSTPTTQDVIAYSTLESLFGEMDYCACDHCRSVLSPAAYLVDLLLFCDKPDSLPKENPLTVLLQRRPDIEHLPLTCENTNTTQPYIDLVNEVLEYYVTKNLSLAGYTGYDTDGSVTSDELMANPQHVSDAAYELLAGRAMQPGGPEPVLPPHARLPFHQPLEKLRRHFHKLDVTLADAMEAVRKTDDLERATEAEYGWRDILMESLGFSRAEYRLLTDRTVSLAKLYGYPVGTSDTDVMTGISNAKAFTRRVGISYEDLIEILRTRFVNPNSALLPRLERLGVSFSTLKAFKDGAMPEHEFEAKLPERLDTSMYGDDVKAWVRNAGNYANIMSLVVLANPAAAADLCDFSALELRYANPDNTANRLKPFEYVRLARFIRVWKKLGWTVEQTDKALTALYPAAQIPAGADDNANRKKLDDGFLTALPRLGVAKKVIEKMKLTPKKDLSALLACFAPIDLHGERSLYRELFLNPAVASANRLFADNGYGVYLNGSAKLFAEREVLRGALQVTDPELAAISRTLGFDDNSALTLDNVTALFRRAWLARKLKLSVAELVDLIEATGINPFEAPDPPTPARPRLPGILQFLDLLSRIRSTSLKASQALYLIWGRDISGKSAPPHSSIVAFAANLRAALTSVEREFALDDDPDVARASMSKVYGGEATDLFFAMLDDTLTTDVEYSQADSALSAGVRNAAPSLSYDDFRKRLAYTGVMGTTTRNDLKNVPAVSNAFKTAVDALYLRTRRLFDSHPELLPLYSAYVDPNDPLHKNRPALVRALVAQLAPRRKREQMLQSLAAVAKADVAFASAVLEVPAVMHAASDQNRAAVDDLTSVEAGGLSARFYFGDDLPAGTQAPDVERNRESTLAYAAPDNALPQNPAGNVSAVWTGYVQAPETGFYKIKIRVDAAAVVAMALDGEAVSVAKSGDVWTNQSTIEFRAGNLYAIAITARKIKDVFEVTWETPGRPNEVIPEQHLFSRAQIDDLQRTYVRFLKIASLAAALKLSGAELAHFASLPAYRIASRAWLNHLPTGGTIDDATAVALRAAFEAILDFALLKSSFGARDGELLAVLLDPVAALKPGDGLLLALSRWDLSSIDALLTRFGKTKADLADIAMLRRVAVAEALLQKAGLSAPAMLAAATNEPAGRTVADLQSALRARYERSEWLKVLGPINDQMRAMQRDALVAYILHQMSFSAPHIDTPEKLFEYFLMDVQMEPVMVTSRVRHALSTVQLFIERILMNLEPRVDPASLDAKQWQWMSRYRVWEANRKVFLYPENWLEPELRHDQSPIFKEALSELLQSDINEDTAALAFGNYLSKLDEIAKLDPCGIHYESMSTAGFDDDVAHVIARTSGAARKYYYRRREYGYWTPWTHVKLDVEDNPVLPVVWKDRLFLFWLRIIKDGGAVVPAAPAEAEPKVDDVRKVDYSKAVSAPRVNVKAVLCWSEYYNNQWQPTRTSDISRPADLGSYATVGDGQFDRSALYLESGPELWGMSAALNQSPLRISIGGGNKSTSYVLYNTHSAPVRGEDQILGPGDMIIAMIIFDPRVIEATADTLVIDYTEAPLAPRKSRKILNVASSYVAASIVVPRSYQPFPWEAPFFYSDRRHTFFVRTSQTPVLVRDSTRYVRFVYEVPPRRIDPLIDFRHGLPIGPRNPIDAVTNPIRIRDTAFNPSSILPASGGRTPIRVAIGRDGTFVVNGREIGINGRVPR